MDISVIDKNFTLTPVNEPDVEWFDALSEPFALHGLLYDKTAKVYEEDPEPGLFLRMPREISKQVSHGVNWLNPMTTGGRLRFMTDSPYVAIKCVEPDFEPLSHMPLLGAHGFSIYVNGFCDGKYSASFANLKAAKDFSYAFSGSRRFATVKGGVNLCELYFPLYGGVRRLYIGLKKGSVLKAPPAYSVQAPVVFYGSSITQGACASRPGNDYASLLSRWLNCDYINLGFSGNGKAEKIMVDYLATLPASAYVLDYDYNAESLAYLEETHMPMYETIRAAKKDVPILFMSKPDLEYDDQTYERRDIIRKTYETAIARGDKNVYFIDGTTLFDEADRDSCTVDTCHPNDLGFYRIAKNVYPVLKTMLKK